MRTYQEVVAEGRLFIVVNHTGTARDPQRDSRDSVQPTIIHGPFSSRVGAEEHAKNLGFRLFDIHILCQP